MRLCLSFIYLLSIATPQVYTVQDKTAQQDNKQTQSQERYVTNISKERIQKALNKLQDEGVPRDQRFEQVARDVQEIDPQWTDKALDYAKREDDRQLLRKDPRVYLCGGNFSLHGAPSAPNCGGNFSSVLSTPLALNTNYEYAPGGVLLQNPDSSSHCLYCAAYISQSAKSYQLPCNGGHRLCNDASASDCYHLCEPYIMQKDIEGTKTMCPRCCLDEQLSEDKGVKTMRPRCYEDK